MSECAPSLIEAADRLAETAAQLLDTGRGDLDGALASFRSLRRDTDEAGYWAARAAVLEKALRDLRDVALDFLSDEYPDGTDAPADAEAARLQRACDSAMAVVISGATDSQGPPQ